MIQTQSANQAARQSARKCMGRPHPTHENAALSAEARTPLKMGCIRSTGAGWPRRVSEGNSLLVCAPPNARRKRPFTAWVVNTDARKGCAMRPRLTAGANLG
jgi:hypothetical protein